MSWDNTAKTINSGENACSANPVPEALERLARDQHETLAIIGMLHDRLGCVCSQPQTKPDGPTPVMASRSPMHAVLIEQGERQQQINNQLRDIIERLTL